MVYYRADILGLPLSRPANRENSMTRTYKSSKIGTRSKPTRHSGQSKKDSGGPSTA